MSHKIFVMADPHFGHWSLFKFKREDGSPLRPLWDNPNDMDEDLIKWHNEIVRPVDKVYYLGDIAMKKQAMDAVMPRLNGHKVLIKGNHDIFQAKDYLKYFKDIRAYHRLDCHWMSHVPVHPGSLGTNIANFQGHIHARQVLLPDGTPDSRYFCVSVERPEVNYRPLEWSCALAYVKERQEKYPPITQTTQTTQITHGDKEKTEIEIGGVASQ